MGMFNSVIKSVVLLAFVTACSQTTVTDRGPSRLPEPTATMPAPPPQWVDYCLREGQEDPNCPHS